MTTVNYAIAGPGAKGGQSTTSAPNLKVLDNEQVKDIKALSEDILSDSERRLKLEARHILFYKLNNPEDWQAHELATGTKKLPSEEITLKQLAVHMAPDEFLEDATGHGKFDKTCIYYIAWLQDNSLETIQAMRKVDADLMSAATVSVKAHGKWSMDDVHENGGIWVKLTDLENDHPIKSLHTFLGSARTCKKEDLQNVEAVNFVAELRRQIASRDSCHLKSKDTFETYFHDPPQTQTPDSGPSTRARSNANKLAIPNKSAIPSTPAEEFETFTSIRTFSKAALADSKLTVTKRNSDDLAASFTTRFVRPPCESFLRSNLDDKGNPTGQYWVEHAWAFTIYLMIRDGGDQNVKTYTPKSDFRLDLQSIFPVIVGEVVSDPIHRSDEWRMLVQVIALLAIGAKIIKGDKIKLVLMAIYLDTKNIARRYLVYRSTTKSGKAIVEILQESFDLKDAVEARKLLLQIYNYVTHIRSYQLQKDIGAKLKLLTEEGRKLQSLHSSLQESRNSRGLGKSKKKSSVGTKLDAVEEESSEGS